MIVVDLVGRVLHVSTNGAELDHKCIDPLNDQRAYFNTTAIFEKDIVLLKDICLPIFSCTPFQLRAIWQQLDNSIDTCRSSDVDLKICLSESSFNCYLESECFSSLDLLQPCSAGRPESGFKIHSRLRKGCSSSQRGKFFYCSVIRFRSRKVLCVSAAAG